MRLAFHSVPTPMTVKWIFFSAACWASWRQSCSPEVSPSVRTTTCDSRPEPALLLDLGQAQRDALVHGGAARIDVEHVDAAG